MPHFTARAFYYGGFAKTVTVEAPDLAAACAAAIEAADDVTTEAWESIYDDARPTFVDAIAEGEDADLSAEGLPAVPAPYDETSVMLGAYGPHAALEEIALLLCPGGDPDGEVNGADFIDAVTAVLEKYGVDKEAVNARHNPPQAQLSHGDRVALLTDYGGLTKAGQLVRAQGRNVPVGTVGRVIAADRGNYSVEFDTADGPLTINALSRADLARAGEQYPCHLITPAMGAAQAADDWRTFWREYAKLDAFGQAAIKAYAETLD